jgi:hypothetical protein
MASDTTSVHYPLEFENFKYYEYELIADKRIDQILFFKKEDTKEFLKLVMRPNQVISINTNNEAHFFAELQMKKSTVGQLGIAEPIFVKPESMLKSVWSRYMKKISSERPITAHIRLIYMGSLFEDQHITLQIRTETDTKIQEENKVDLVEFPKDAADITSDGKISRMEAEDLIAEWEAKPEILLSEAVRRLRMLPIKKVELIPMKHSIVSTTTIGNNLQVNVRKSKDKPIYFVDIAKSTGGLKGRISLKYYTKINEFYNVFLSDEIDKCRQLFNERPSLGDWSCKISLLNTNKEKLILDNVYINKILDMKNCYRMVIKMSQSIENIWSGKHDKCNIELVTSWID